MKKVLILGGGYGGLKCAVTLQNKLKDKDVEVTLISKHDYHYQTTLLHKVAAGTCDGKKLRIFYRNILDRVGFIKDEIEKIDLEQRAVSGRAASYTYDYLVISLGFEVNSYGISGVKEYAYGISTLDVSLQILTKIEDNFKNYTYDQDPNNLSVIVCGNGFTGVEFVSEFAKKARSLCRIYGLDRELLKIYLIGRCEQVLPMFDEKLGKAAAQKLKDIGVTMVTGCIVRCERDGVVIQNGEQEEKISGNMIIWSTGVKGSSIIEKSGIKNQGGSVEVNEFLQMPSNKNVFVIGDSAIVKDGDRPYPHTAQIASQMGEHCALSLIRLLNDEEPCKKFVFKHKGTICSIGHTDGVGKVFGFNVRGELAAFMKNMIENIWIFSIANLITVIKKGQFRFRRND
ncbi:MAG: NADH dehydrogenase FAD-containing subunit [Deltaproteobacteria bacterium]|nr:MAG: NADH dehydrogenase FAD-containing subunit [Deltaproteobacteria bacterium]